MFVTSYYRSNENKPTRLRLVNDSPFVLSKFWTVLKTMTKRLIVY